MTETYNEVLEIFDKLDDKRAYRIEALRAASRIMAGTKLAVQVSEATMYERGEVIDVLLGMSGSIARWLETGER